MNNPYEELNRQISLSRLNNMKKYNSLRNKSLHETQVQRDPIASEFYPGGSVTSDSSILSNDSNYRQTKVNWEREYLRNEASNFYLSNVLHNKGLSSGIKFDEHRWNSSIDHNHPYYLSNEIHGDPYQLNDYLVSRGDTSPIIPEDLTHYRDDSPKASHQQTPPECFPAGSYSTSLYPVPELTAYFPLERNKTERLEERLSNEDLPKSQTERSKRRKINKQEKEEKICGICGDNAKSLHFGGMACDSCKAFFRRSVQTKSHQSFKCLDEHNCQITKKNRKNCQYCRFQKCLHIGMEIRWVMPEAERMELWKAKLARHREVKSNSETITTYIPTPPNLPTNSILSSKDSDTINNLTILQEVIFSSTSLPSVCHNAEDMSNLFFDICQKLQKFFFRIEEFQELSQEDQSHTMKNGISTSIYIHGAYTYDPLQDMWPCEESKPYLKIPTVTTKLLKDFTVFNEIYESLMTFYRKYGPDIKDEKVLLLLCIISLFFGSPEINCKNQVTIKRNYFINLLKHYLFDKFGEMKGDIQFGHLMGCYEYVKKIVSYHNKVSIEPTVNRKNIKTIDKCNVTFDRQMKYLMQGLHQARIAGLPEFASVFGPQKTDDKSVVRKVNKKATYAWLTSVIFGYETKNDRLLSFFPPEILTQKRPFGFDSQRVNIRQIE